MSDDLVVERTRVECTVFLPEGAVQCWAHLVTVPMPAGFVFWAAVVDLPARQGEPPASPPPMDKYIQVVFADGRHSYGFLVAWQRLSGSPHPDTVHAPEAVAPPAPSLFADGAWYDVPFIPPRAFTVDAFLLVGHAPLSLAPGTETATVSHAGPA